MQHKLKTWQQYMPDIKTGVKTFEVRENDRGFKVGDKLRLEGWDNDKQQYTNDWCEVDVTYILNGGQFGIKSGYVVMGINITNWHIGQLK